MEKGKGKLVRLGDVAEVRRGFTTGANEFFYLDEKKIKEWGIEKEFLKPVIVSPRESSSVIVRLQDLKYRAFVCHESKKNLKGTVALRYIEWGEKQGFHLRPSCKNKSLWYEFPEKIWAIVLWPMIHNDRLSVFWNERKIAVDHNLFEILGFDDDIVWGSLAWTGQLLFRELHGRANLGQGALKTEGVDIRTLYSLNMKTDSLIKSIRTSRAQLSERPIGTVEAESQTDDRRNLDNIIFDALNLTQGECDAVYEAVINLVNQRLNKARSL